MACLDTTVILDLLGRAGRRKRADAQAKLKQLEHDQPHSVTRFTIAELLVGVELSGDRVALLSSIRELLEPVEILEFDAKSMRTYPRIYARLQAINRMSGTMDMLIASVALSHGQRFVTRNAKHYELIPGLRVDAY